MTRPSLEVADLIREAGTAFLVHSRKWFTWLHLKILTAIVCCRTSALGGHIDECSNCGHRAISFHSCLMESIFKWGADRQRGLRHAASRPFDSPLWLALQQFEQFVGRPKLALAKARRHNRFDGLQLFGGVGSNVDFRRCQIAVPQPKRDFSDVLRCL